jgi:diguanylate cyclase (GGDEF)-like protein/PAS domain S-box-containing protein
MFPYGQDGTYLIWTGRLGRLFDRGSSSNGRLEAMSAVPPLGVDDAVDPVSQGVARAELFELSSDLLATFDRAGHFLDLNIAWERTLGWDRAELIGRRAVDLVHPEDFQRTVELKDHGTGETPDVVEFENRFLCKDGGYRWLQWSARLSGESWYSVARDVTDRRILEERAVRDPLTGLPNRTALIERLAQAVSRLGRHPGFVAVLFVDLDHFKVINDGRGHEAGDRFLCAAADRLRGTVREGDSVARFGGDEFVILVQDASRAFDVTDVAGRVVDALKRPIMSEGDEVVVSGSVGIALTSSPGIKPESLLHQADIAMYRAKARGGGCYELFSDQVRAEIEQRLSAERMLRLAVDEGQFILHYQPIVALPEVSVSRCEALLRWQHPVYGQVLPGEFLALAEETRLIVPIGEWVLEQACRQTRDWRRAGRDIAITVNVSTVQLDEPEFPEVVRRTLAATDLPPPALCLEITETAIMRHIGRVAPRLEALRRIGVRIAMDDFGSGYSSLAYLRSLPLDIIKIDKSFVAGIGHDAQDRSIVAGMIKLGRDTNRGVIAKGVETESLHAELVGLGCDLAQGFLYDRPCPPEQLVLDGYSSRVRPGIGDPLVIREFMRQIGIPARIRP